MARITDIDQTVLQSGGTDWIERRWGESSAMNLSFEDDENDQAFNLTGWTVRLLAVEIRLTVETQGDSIKLGQASDAGMPPREIEATVADQGATPGHVSFTMPSTGQDNPGIADTKLPALVVWIIIARGADTISRPFGVFFRTGPPAVPDA